MSAEVRERLGGKGEGLVWLTENRGKQEDSDYVVPPFEVLPLNFFEHIQRQNLRARLVTAMSRVQHVNLELPEEIRAQVAQIISKVPGPLKVRSSSFLEDGEHSFAGRYYSETVMTPTLDNVAKATMRVFASLSSEKARAYRNEKGLGEDRMAVVFQQFVKPDYSGVILTSNPQFPTDLTIEFGAGEEGVTDARGETYIIDFDKKTGKIVFESENLGDLGRFLFNIDGLFRIGREIEKRAGPSDVEFLVKDGEFYLVQKRQLTGLVPPIKVSIPKYKPGQFLGKTSVCRGRGSVKLPVVEIGEMGDMIAADAQVHANIGEVAVDLAEQGIRGYFEGLKALDSRFKEGYVLVIPRVDESAMGRFGRFNPSGIKPTIDNLTPHKRAVITTQCKSLASHVMTIARERGIAYAGFGEGDKALSTLRTGDIVSIYFVGREARVYKEEVARMRLRERFPDIHIEVIEIPGNGWSYRTGWELGGDQVLKDDVINFLNTSGRSDWKYKPSKVYSGGLIVNPAGQDLSFFMSRVINRSYLWSLGLTDPKASDNRLPEEEVRKIEREYREYLGV